MGVPTCPVSSAQCPTMEENIWIVVLLGFVLVLKHFLRRRLDIKTNQHDGNPWTNITDDSDGTEEKAVAERKVGRKESSDSYCSTEKRKSSRKRRQPQSK